MSLGQLVNGRWTDDEMLHDASGAFVRTSSGFTGKVTAEDQGSPHPLEPGRYRLIVSLSCPWSHRTVIARAIAGLDEAVPMSDVEPVIGTQGWQFRDRDQPWQERGVHWLHQLYTASDHDFTGRVTVPVLWDDVEGRIVSNDSASIMRMLDEVFSVFGEPGRPTLRPYTLAGEIDAINDRVHKGLANAVYQAGFAVAQGAYEEAVQRVFETLEWLESRLSGQRYLVGDTPTEADWRLFTALVRFDEIYNTHFKCNRRRLMDYPALCAYARDLYQRKDIAGTVAWSDIRVGYYRSHPDINPHGIVPIGPQADWSAPHGRERLGLADKRHDPGSESRDRGTT